MRGPTGAEVKNRGRVAAILVTLAAPALAYLVVRAAAIGLLPMTAATLPPSDNSRLLRPLVLASAVPQHRLDSQTLNISRQAATSSPLAFEPFFLAAKAAEQQGRLEQAVRLMEEAKRRRPSFLMTRLQLVAYYGQSSRFDELLAEMNFVLRMSGEARRLILPELLKLIRIPAGRQALATVLADNPEWRADFFGAAQSGSFRPQDTLALLNLVRAQRRGANVDLERGLYLQSLMSAGQFTRAKELWLEALPPAERARHRLLFDGSFAALRAGPPFAWTLHDLDVGRAEMIAVSGEPSYLDVHYFGGRNVLLAEQVLALTPGRYTLAVNGRSDDAERTGRLYWAVSCLPDGPELGKLGLSGLQPQDTRRGIGFTVPARGCVGQRLWLGAEAGDVSLTVNARLSSVEVKREN